jgi:Flp pilus assembly protein TadG
MLDNLGSTTSGTSVGQWTDGTSNNQKWTVSTTGSYRKLMCVTGNNYLDSLGHTTKDGTVGQLTSSTSNNQQWLIQPIGNGYYYVVNRANGLYLDSTGSSSDGAISVFWTGEGNYNQQWQFVTP